MNIKKAIIRYKIYLDRSRQYSIWLQFFMNAGTFITVVSSDSLKGYMKHHALLSGIVGFLIVLLSHLIVGRIDTKWGFYAEENRRHSETNPVTMEILENLKRIEEKINL